MKSNGLVALSGGVAPPLATHEHATLTCQQHYPQVPREVDDFQQAGALYRLQPADAQQRLVDDIAGSLAQVSREDIIARSIEHFRRADAGFGARVAKGVAERRGVGVAL